MTMEYAHERLPVRIYARASQASAAAAREIADLIRWKASDGKQCVLGLATGSSPVNVYNDLHEIIACETCGILGKAPRSGSCFIGWSRCWVCESCECRSGSGSRDRRFL